MKKFFAFLISGLFLFMPGCSSLEPGSAVKPEPTIKPEKMYATTVVDCGDSWFMDFIRADFPHDRGDVKIHVSGIMGKINLAPGEMLTGFFSASCRPLELGDSNRVVDLSKCDYVEMFMNYDSTFTTADLKLTMQTVTGDWYYKFRKNILPEKGAPLNFITIRALFKDFLPVNDSNKKPINLSQVKGGQFDVLAKNAPVSGKIIINDMVSGCLPDFYDTLSFVKEPSGLRLDSLPCQKIYQSSRDSNLLGSVSGYGLYGDTTKISAINNVLNIQYQIPSGKAPGYTFPGWTSIRRQFKDVLLNASGDSGISLEIKVDTASAGVDLRLSLCDVLLPEDVRTPWADEVLSCDLPGELNKTSDWHTINVPFSKFKYWKYLPVYSISYAYMYQRLNDRCLFTEQICGYEISIMGNEHSEVFEIKLGEPVKIIVTNIRGAFSIRNIRTY